MDTLFLKLVNMSITAGYIIIAAVVLRLIFKKAPKWIHCLFWGIAGVRLVFPFSIKSVFSIIPKPEAGSAYILDIIPKAADKGMTVINTATSGTLSDQISNTTLNVHTYTVIWIIGIIIMMLYGAVSYIYLHRKIKEARQDGKNTYFSNNIVSPFILGIIKPRIFLPFDIDDKMIPFVIAHEQAHIRRGDHFIKPIGFLLLTLYWFNPLIWVAYILLCRDIEYACDEAVMRKLGQTQKKPYSEALLSCSIGRKTIAGCPLAFGEIGVKERIKNVLNYKKPTFWVIVISILACIVLALVLLTNPKDDKTSEFSNTGLPEDTYEFQECIYINPLSSYFPFEGTGELYKITKNSLIIVNKETGETTTEIAFENVKSSSFSDEEWADLFIFDYGTDDISQLNFEERNMWKLSNEYRIYKMDDEIWLMRLAGKNGVWSIYKLKLSDIEIYKITVVNPKPEFYFMNTDETNPLDKIISNIIWNRNKDSFGTGDIATTAYTILKTVDEEDQIIIYAMAMYMEFDYINTNLEVRNGVHSPIAITLEKADNGGYGLEEYWIPDEGEKYASSISEKFPDDIISFDAQDFVKSHIRACYESAVVQSGMDVNARIDQLFNIICSSPSYSSNSKDYIQAHEDEYIELQNYGTYTLQYCFELFDKGGQTGLKGHIMKAVCSEIMIGLESSGYELEYTNGQEWYDKIKELLPWK